LDEYESPPPIAGDIIRATAADIPLSDCHSGIDGGESCKNTMLGSAYDTVAKVHCFLEGHADCSIQKRDYIQEIYLSETNGGC
jgi:hypothetical protein